MRNKILIIVLALSYICNADNTRQFNYKGDFEKESSIQNNEWQVVSSTSDKDTVIKVTWYQKHGIQKTEYCKALFKNKNIFKLVSPTLNLKIECDNINDIKYIKVFKK